MTPRLTLIAAVARNGVIGDRGALPWRLSSDMKRFKAATMGKPVLMGRATWESLPKTPLPGRQNIVLTRNHAFRAAGAWVYTDLEAALAAARAMAQRSGASEVCVIGGAEIYAACLLRADRIILTEVDASPEGDAHFPMLDPGDWREVSRQSFPSAPADEAACVLRVLERQSPSA